MVAANIERHRNKSVICPGFNVRQVKAYGCVAGRFSLGHCYRGSLAGMVGHVMALNACSGEARS